MIARFDGKCGTCGCLLKKGDEIFYDKAEGAHCWPCRDNPQPTPEQYAIAQRLGFLSYDAALNQQWSGVRFLHHADRGDIARGGSAAHPRQDTLWSMPSGDSGEE